jgi:hypothetical protein
MTSWQLLDGDGFVANGGSARNWFLETGEATAAVAGRIRRPLTQRQLSVTAGSKQTPTGGLIGTLCRSAVGQQSLHLGLLLTTNAAPMLVMVDAVHST